MFKKMNLKTYQVKSKQILKFSLEQGLYAQVFMIHRSNSDGIKEKYKTKTINFQGRPARTKHWFYLDRVWLKGNFMTREPYFYKKTI